ncbi:flagellar basal body P-ring formation chaperone FlgA [Lysobacter korlensis]|uniref:Flagella basal body P-ring formation protein FlgA n=1 Tax=Lysobacter korlensis TaxID=553636 RepID=A0ABV6RJD5_9GAMM
MALLALIHPLSRYPLAFALMAATGVADATATHPVEDIRATAIAALGADAANAQATLGAGVRFARCSQPLQAVATGAQTAQVRCPDAPGWKLYVPVRVRREADVVVLRGPVRAGQPITADQLTVQRRDLGQAASPGFSDPAQVIGMTPSKSLAAGAALTTADVMQGPPLRRGDPVVLLTRIGGVEVRMAGRALGPAGAGGTVSAENVESRRIVRGRLSAPGVVEIVR